jgi:hypothetical protein
MNYLVILDAHANELEKILSGTKSMLISEIDPACPGDQLLQPGDHLYFLRNHDDYVIRVKAIVERVPILVNQMDENLSPVLKEFQPRLQLTEEQYNYWSAKHQAMLVEFDHAEKIGQKYIALHKVSWRTNWIAFQELGSITR